MGWRGTSEVLAAERGELRLRAAIDVLEEPGREAEDQSMRVVREAKATGIPAQFPAVALNQGRDRPDQRLFPHVRGVVL